MKILVLNCGSSSLKYQLINMDDESVLASGLCERIGTEGSEITHKPTGKEKVKKHVPMPSHQEAVQLVMDTLIDADHGVIKDASEVGAVGHRVVHGGDIYSDSVIIDEVVKNAIKDCIDLGPLHNPANLMGIEACEKAMQNTPNVAVFDTAFGQSMEEKAYLYAIPYRYYENLKIRRYGFHGTSHKYVSEEIIKRVNLPEGHRRVIVCHLGNGASISASIDGKCIDTSMGLTPLDGLVMGTRSGEIDPAIIQFIAKHDKKTLDEVLEILNKESGLLGLSCLSSDSRDIETAAANGDKKAQTAIDVFNYRVAKYIGGYITAMNGVDAICFTAGIGENSNKTRKGVCEYFKYLGIQIDDDKNNVRGEFRRISADYSKIPVYLVPTNEELAIARETLQLIK